MQSKISVHKIVHLNFQVKYSNFKEENFNFGLPIAETLYIQAQPLFHYKCIKTRIKFFVNEVHHKIAAFLHDVP